MARFREIPVFVDAFRWTGGPDQTEDPVWAISAIKSGLIEVENQQTPHVQLRVQTENGGETCRQGDWLCRDARGEIFPVKAEEFDLIYEDTAKGRESLRQCWWQALTWEKNKFSTTGWNRGWFHGWGCESTEAGSTNSVALVETEEGFIVEKASNRISFAIEKPTRED